MIGHSLRGERAFIIQKNKVGGWISDQNMAARMSLSSKILWRKDHLQVLDLLSFVPKRRGEGNGKNNPSGAEAQRERARRTILLATKALTFTITITQWESLRPNEYKVSRLLLILLTLLFPCVHTSLLRLLHGTGHPCLEKGLMFIYKGTSMEER